jgi:hypothetical protein
MSFAEGSSQYTPAPSHVNSHYDSSTPPPPPPKQAGPPLPPPPGNMNSHNNYSNVPQAQISLPEPGWLPPIVHELATNDLGRLVEDAELQAALLNDTDNTHGSIAASQEALRQMLESNIEIASSLQQLERRVTHERAATQTRLLSLRALEQQHKSKIVETEDTLKSFSPMALYQRLNSSLQEQDGLLKGIEDSFLEEGGLATDREVQDFVRRLREAKRLAFLRHERKERWDEGRVGGWR